MSVQGTDGANHERFTSLLRADGYVLGDGPSQNLWHSIGILEGSRSSKALSLSRSSEHWRSRQRLTRWLISCQLPQLAFVRCLDALKSGCSVVAIHISGISRHGEAESTMAQGSNPSLFATFRAGLAIDNWTS